MFEERLHPRGRGGKFSHTPGGKAAGELKVTARDRNGPAVDATPGNGMDRSAMKPAFAGAARKGDMISFDLPASGGGLEKHEGRIASIERVNDGRSPRLDLKLEGNDRQFKVGVNLRSWVAPGGDAGKSGPAFAGGGKAGSMKPGDRFSYNGRDYDVTEASDLFGGRRKITTKQGEEFRFAPDMALDPPKVRAPGESLGRGGGSGPAKGERVVSRDGVGAPVRDSAGPMGGRARLQAGDVRPGMAVEHPTKGTGVIEGTQGKNGGPVAVRWDKPQFSHAPVSYVDRATELYPADGKAGGGAKATLTPDTVSEGMRVQHPQHGGGTVVNADSRRSGFVVMKSDAGQRHKVDLNTLEAGKGEAVVALKPDGNGGYTGEHNGSAYRVDNVGGGNFRAAVKGPDGKWVTLPAAGSRDAAVAAVKKHAANPKK